MVIRFLSRNRQIGDQPLLQKSQPFLMQIKHIVKVESFPILLLLILNILPKKSILPRRNAEIVPSLFKQSFEEEQRLDEEEKRRREEEKQRKEETERKHKEEEERLRKEEEKRNARSK